MAGVSEEDLFAGGEQGVDGGDLLLGVGRMEPVDEIEEGYLELGGDVGEGATWNDECREESGVDLGSEIDRFGCVPAGRGVARGRL